MEITHILVDFENVQPKDLRLLAGDRFRVVIFLGPHQNRIDLDIVESLQPLGSNVTYVQSDRRTKNAVDFHIAFHLGRLLQGQLGTGERESRRDRFVIVTKDGGFDGLLSHVRSLGYKATKAVTIAEVLEQNAVTDETGPGSRSSAKPEAMPVNRGMEVVKSRPKEKVKIDIVPKLVANFRQHPKARPATLVALERHIGTALGGKATSSAVQNVIASMERAGVMKITDKYVEYSLPPE
jgi:hypothetical protein